MSEEQTFSSKLVRTSNVAKELLVIAKTYSLSVHDLDFNVISSEIFVSEVTDNGSETEFVKASEDQLAALENADLPVNVKLRLKQIYDLEIFPLETVLFPKLKLSIAANKTLTAVYITIKAGSVIDKTAHIKDDLVTFFNHKKLRTQIIIDLWDHEMLAELAHLSAKVEVNGSVTFEEDQRILVSKSLASVDTVDDELILHFEHKKENEENSDRIDYKKRDFITATEVGELLITYIKPQEGIPGRNCRGEFIEVPPAGTLNVPTFDVDPECIEVKEDDTKIEYIAKKNGYIDMDGTTYYIKEALEVSEISFKSTGNVNAGLNADVSIVVKETDPLSDAIGMGVEVEASEIDVEGNAGSNSRVKAKKIRIGGQTHKTSVMIADVVDVNVHHGLIQAKEVKVKRLEHGKIEGNTVHVEQAAGGEIIAKHVTIDILQSHMKIIASESITIKKMLGSENTLEINQSLVGKNVEASDSLEEELKEKQIEINLSKKELDKQKELFSKHKDTMIEIKKRLIAYKKAGAKLPVAFVKKYKEIQALESKIGIHEKEHHLMIDTFEMMQQRRSRFQRSVLEAQVINEGTWKGHNEVRFHLTSPEQDFIFVPPEGLNQSVIMLKYDKENEEYSVVSQSADIPGL